MAMALRFVDGLWSRCCSLLETGQVAQARPLLQRLLQLEVPQTIRSEASLMLADLLRWQGEYQSARRHLSAALVGDPEDPALHHMLGYLHDEDSEDGNDNQALRHLKRAVKLAPDSSECHRALGEHLFQHDEEARGLTHLHKAVELEPDNLDSLKSLVSALVEAGEEQRARQTIRELQFRLGRAHPVVQSLWNELYFASTVRHQQSNNRLSTLPMLKAVTEPRKTAKRQTTAPILRFDAGHQRMPRTSRRAPQSQD